MQQLSPDSREQIEAIIARFEEAWRRGERPAIDAFLPDEPSLRRAALVELVHTDLECGFKAGEQVRVECYLQRYPELSREDSVVLDLIAAEYTLRCRGREPVHPAAYLERFSRYADQLKKVLAGKGQGLAPSPATGAPVAEPLLPETKDLNTTGSYAGHPPGGSTAPDAADAAEPPSHEYEMLRVLGRGGMGVVYLARQTALDRLVAFKMIRSGDRADQGELARFRAEAQALARLKHPHIVQVYDVGEQDGQPFFSLEFVEGGSLQQKLANTPQPPLEAARLAETLARAVEAAHRAGVVHRDLKPANVLLAPDGTPKITDFGLAKRLDEDQGQTHSGALVGTPSYMAPEQAVGDVKAVGALADVYALGVILYEMLTGNLPFRGATVYETLDQIKQLEPVPPRRSQPKVPRDLETICLKCLEKLPGRRYASAADLADDLQRYLDGMPIQARPVGPAKRIIKFALRRRALAAAIALGLLAIVVSLAGGGYYLYRRALDAEAALAKQTQLNTARSAAEELLKDGERARSGEQWSRQESFAKEALALVGEELSLADLKERAERLRDDARLIQRFLADRDRAHFHAMLTLEGDNRQAHRNEAASAARTALACFRLGSDPAEPVLPGELTPEARKKLLAQCYELYFTWAGARAPLQAGFAGQRRAELQEELDLLDRAAGLGLRTKAYSLHRAALLEARGDAEPARQAREQGAAMGPSGALDHFLLGWDHRLRGEHELSLAHLKKAVGLQPDHFWANYFLANAYLKVGRPDAAVSSLTNCVRVRDFVWAYLLRGFAQGQSNDFEEAFADFDRADKLGPDELARYGLLVNRGVVHYLQGRHLERKEPGQAQQCYQNAVENLRQAVTLRPGQVQTYPSLAEAYLRCGNVAEAKAQLDRALAKFPSVALYRMRAKLHIQSKDFDAALTDLERVTAGTPDRAGRDRAEDQTEYGRILYRRQRYAEALPAFDAALRADPSYATAHRWRGEALVQLNRLPEAIAALDAYVARGSASASAHRSRALAHNNLGSHAAAIADYTRALQIDRDSGLPPLAKTLADRGWTYLGVDSPKLALEDFEAALRNPGEHRANCHAGRGYARVKLGQWRPAVADAEEAVKLGPPQPRLFYNAARIYAQAAALLTADRNLDARSARERAQQYQERAVALLGRALEGAPAAERASFWKQNVKKDPALLSIRRQSSFLQMARQWKLEP